MKSTLIFVSLLFLFSCNQTAEINADFNMAKEQFINDLWIIYPGWASWAGDHSYDSVLYVPNKEHAEMQLAFAEKYFKMLRSFNLDNLNQNNKTDYYMIENMLEDIEWGIKEFKSGQIFPSNYNLGGTFNRVLTYDGQPLETRLSNIYKKLENVPAYYKQAKENLKNPTIEHTELAVLQNKGSIPTFKNSIKDSLEKSTWDPDKKEQLQKRLDDAVAAIKDYIHWLEKDLKPSLKDNARSFRLGKELYDAKFKLDIQASSTAEEIYQKALDEKNRVHGIMADLTNEIWTQYFPNKKTPPNSLQATRQLIDVIALKHVHRDSFITAIKKQIPELEAFVKKRDLLFLDPDKPLTVRETPAYMRGTGAGASISAPGPYDKNAETFYNVTPLNDYSEEEAESYLREYNFYMLQILNIHEAIPGHYAQLVYSNQSPSIIKSILGNGAMIEGWANYTEIMMLEEGYNNSPEMWLMYYKWYLRVVCNTILDYGVHVLNLSKTDAMDLLINQAFQEETEANGKWRRVKLSQVQLCSYFAGFTEIYSLREEIKSKLGDNFKLKEFHEKFLSYGSAPVKYVRELMLEDLQ